MPQIFFFFTSDSCIRTKAINQASARVRYALYNFMGTHTDKKQFKTKNQKKRYELEKCLNKKAKKITRKFN